MFCSFFRPCKSTFISSSPLLRNLLFLSSTLSLLYFILLFLFSPNPFSSPLPFTIRPTISSPTSLHHIVFGIASSSKSWPIRSSYLRIWYASRSLRGYAFLDNVPPNYINTPNSILPTILVSKDTSHIPYSYRGGLRSAVRVARIVSEIVALDLPDVRWVVLGDDDTVFFPENLVKTLSKYNWEQWFYVGGSSESVEQNVKYSFDMAFGGGGIAISYPLARVLAGVLDSCLVRYAGLYGSDARIFACLAELGVGLTKEAGFHQVDIRGDLFGMLSSHPLVPLVSLHHLDYVEPIFPNMTRTQAIEHLFEAVNADPGRILEQTVCYDCSNSRTISISWGYSVQVFEGNQLLPTLLPLQQTFMPWKRSRNITSSQYMFKTREFPRDPCKRPAIFFLENVVSDTDGIRSHYRRHLAKECLSRKVARSNLVQIKVFSQKLNLDVGQLQAPRRQCCDVLPSSFDKVMEIGIRKCKGDELISMHS